MPTILPPRDPADKENVLVALSHEAAPTLAVGRRRCPAPLGSLAHQWAVGPDQLDEEGRQSARLPPPWPSGLSRGCGGRGEGAHSLPRLGAQVALSGLVLEIGSVFLEDLSHNVGD